jgi:hypothetical protein
MHIRGAGCVSRNRAYHPYTEARIYSARGVIAESFAADPKAKRDCRFFSQAT